MQNQSQSLSQIYQHSIQDPENFWAKQAESIEWGKKWDKVLDHSRPPYFYEWFKGATCNTCHNAIDRHVLNGAGDRLAIIYDSPLTGTKSSITYKQLLGRVEKVAGMLLEKGAKKGDRAIIYMPMIPEAAIAMLACARIGVIHSVVFGGFAANELATRIKDSTPNFILTASCGLEPNKVIAYQNLVETAMGMVPNQVKSVFVWQRDMHAWDLSQGAFQSISHDWKSCEAKAKPAAPVMVSATDPLYILYTSGTTGQPKGVVRDNGGHMVALLWSMVNIYNIKPGEVFWAASDVGWVVGHSYIVYAPLLLGATTLIYEGKPVGTPDAGAFWRVIEEHKVVTLFTAPTAFRAIKKEDSDASHLKRYKLDQFRALFLAGERCDTDTLFWAQNILNVPVIDHWWQTETGWSIAANCLGLEPLPVKPGSPSCAVVGYDLRILDENHQEVKRGDMGDICIKLPLPPSCLPTLWNADQRYIDSYLTAHPGYYNTGDAGYMDEENYIFVMSRTDDIINVAGHRLSTGGMEEVLSSHADVAECAVIGVADQMKGQLPMGFVVLKSNSTKTQTEIKAELVKLIRDRIGPVAAFKLVLVVNRLPKTRSGKILRSTMAKIADSQQFNMPATIDDPAVLDEIKLALQTLGYAK